MAASKLVDSVEYQLAIGNRSDVASDVADASIVSLLRKALASDVAQVATKTYTFVTATTGATGAHTLFTVTGGVRVKLYAICTTGLVPAVGGATIEVGTAADTPGIIAQATAANFLAGEIWDDNDPTTKLEPDSAIPEVVIGDGADIIITVATQAVASGVIVFRAEYTPLTPNGNLVAA